MRQYFLEEVNGAKVKHNQQSTEPNWEKQPGQHLTALAAGPTPNSDRQCGMEQNFSKINHWPISGMEQLLPSLESDEQRMTGTSHIDKPSSPATVTTPTMATATSSSPAMVMPQMMATSISPFPASVNHSPLTNVADRDRSQTTQPTISSTNKEPHSSDRNQTNKEVSSYNIQRTVATGRIAVVGSIPFPRSIPATETSRESC